MTAAIPNPLDDSRYLPASHATSLEKTFTGYIAACEVCGADCWWVARDPAGTCPCTVTATVTDSEAAA